MQNWRFVVVKDSKPRRQVRHAARNQPQAMTLAQRHAIAIFVAIGKGTKNARDRLGQLSLNEVVITNKFA